MAGGLDKGATDCNDYSPDGEYAGFRQLASKGISNASISCIASLCGKLKPYCY